ncbi:hypothetical protein LINGRAHAP2_LOCUS19991 [Linum grandiflorum]
MELTAALNLNWLKTLPFPNPSSLKLTARSTVLQSTSTSSSSSFSAVSPSTKTAPSMADILASSKSHNLDLHLKTFGPFFRITATSLETGNELGRAQGVIRVWFGGKKIIHLDSIRLTRETIGMERSIFGIGLFIGAVAIRHGYDCRCNVAQLLAINDSDLYHSKFYKRIGFKEVHQVTGSTIGDVAHMLVWGGIGTRMDARIDELLVKWCTRFTPSS